MFSGPITLFSRNYASGQNIMQPMNTATIPNIANTSIYTVLSNYTQSIQALTDEYAQGEFALVAGILTQSTYNQMAIELNDLAQDPAVYPDYEILRKTIVSAFAGIYQSIIQYSNLLETETQLAAAQEMANILKDPEKLQDYINKQKSRRALFPESKVKLNTAAQLKPEYAEYIRLYGFPQGGVFDMDKLAEILRHNGNNI
jgi:hypothetical protein